MSDLINKEYFRRQGTKWIRLVCTGEETRGLWFINENHNEFMIKNSTLMQLFKNDDMATRSRYNFLRRKEAIA